MPDQLEIQPLSAAFDLRVTDLPGSKSLTNRALLLAALADGVSTLTGALFSDDTIVMLAALGHLGFQLTIDEANRTVTVTGQGGAIPAKDADLFLGNAGTAMRFLTAACCLGQGIYRLDGIPRMRQRPIGQLVNALDTLGATIQYEQQPGYPPLRIWAGGLQHADHNHPTRLPNTVSSQYITAILQVAPCCDNGVTLHLDTPVISAPYVRMTLDLMQRFGVHADAANDLARIHIPPQSYQPLNTHIEPDASNASYFLAAAALVPGSRCTIEGLGAASLQGDIGFAHVLERMGAAVHMEQTRVTVAAPPDGQPLQGIDVDLNHMPDTAQTLGPIALFAQGPTTIRNVGNLRVKETDRMAALQTELTKLGATVTVQGDDLHITPPPGNRVQPAAIDTYDDHRMAMGFALVGLQTPGVVIREPACVNKTFPDYFTYLDRLRANPAASSIPEGAGG